MNVADILVMSSSASSTATSTFSDHGFSACVLNFWTEIPNCTASADDVEKDWPSSTEALRGSGLSME